MEAMFQKQAGPGIINERIEYNSIQKGAYNGLLGLYNSEEIYIETFDQLRMDRESTTNEIYFIQDMLLTNHGRWDDPEIYQAPGESEQI